MTKYIGALSLRKSLNNINANTKEIVWLMGLGSLVVIMHNFLRIPLRLPGHHGIEWMTLLIIGKLTSKNRFAASISSLTASGISLIPAMGFHDPFIVLTFFAPGAVIDIGYYFIKKMKQHYYLFAFLLILITGFAHMTKPLIKWGISLIFQWPYGSFLYGVLYPMISYFIFGIIGTSFGIGIIFLSQKAMKKH